jgi:Arf-GAP/SH3 domain/ANK repeat/PH domain-containing protein
MPIATAADEDDTLDDGPVFRATIAGLEGKTAAFRLRVKKLIKRASEAREYYRAWSEAQQRLQQSMFAIADTNPSAMKPILDSYLGTAFAKLTTFKDYEDRLLQLYIIDPLRKLYEQDIKAAEGKKREFEEESRDYYAFVSRYLSKKHDASKKLEKDSKYSTRRKNFELKRFDYYCYMQDLHGGRKEQEVLRQMTLFSEKQSDALLKVGSTIQELKPALDSLLQDVENARNDFKLARTEREEKRRLIEKNAEQDEPVEAEARRKEGILWALAKPGLHTDPKVVQKLNWHKFWVVLAGGQITEYRDWKEGVNHTGDPIDLRMATVRAARNVERRFCFEIITPHFKRVYQTTGEEELESWIKHIQAAIEGLLDGSASQKSFDQERVQHNREVKQTGGNAGAIFGSSGSRRSTLSTELLRNDKEDSRRLLSLMREADPQNTTCADCGSSSKVEWCSINLAVILCIECSGVHRSLGSHISKIRSLTMDSSFNPDLIDLLCHIGNRVSNAIYEATLGPNADFKPTEKSSPETRTRFITAKYVDRSFVEYPSISPNDVLLGSLSSGNVSAAYGALASRADPNVVDENGISAVSLSLMSLSPPSSPGHSGITLRDDATFPLAELLIQNGAELPTDLSRLSPHARGYIASKVRQDTPAVPNLQRSISNANASIVNGAQKLQKRISSSGSRMLKQQPSLSK